MMPEPSEYQARNCWNKRERSILSSPPRLSPALASPFRALAHEHVRKVRSVQKSRGVIYHLQMIASRAVKAIRFNACIHAAAKSLSRVFSLAFFFSSPFFPAPARILRSGRAFCVDRDHRCPDESTRKSVVASSLPFGQQTSRRGIYWLATRFDSARITTRGDCERSNFRPPSSPPSLHVFHVNWKIPPWFKPHSSLFDRVVRWIEATLSLYIFWWNRISRRKKLINYIACNRDFTTAVRKSEMKCRKDRNRRYERYEFAPRSDECPSMIWTS